ncbi:hypothetical protein [Coleofasciculus sp. FACHB-1120]|uniref:hypothetical protein n=1 Tax=Coleofasciculus sp. FACHB-1120 TaxID=2692783 RepID=UPI001687C3D2|nr:hypothetical protein [Coleofasciculus sp. FACHB-1120]MBD2742237.1 hypothetical protein [Coleofasciculus sp. FACHB-1120]
MLASQEVYVRTDVIQTCVKKDSLQLATKRLLFCNKVYTRVVNRDIKRLATVA